METIFSNTLFTLILAGKQSEKLNLVMQTSWKELDWEFFLCFRDWSAKLSNPSGIAHFKITLEPDRVCRPLSLISSAHQTEQTRISFSFNVSLSLERLLA